MQLATIKPTTKLVLFLSIIILFSAVSLFAVNSAFMVTDQIYAGVMVGDISVGGLSEQAAKEKIAAFVKEHMKEAPIVITYQGQTWPLEAKEIDMVIDVEGLAHKAYSVGREGSLFSCLQERFLTINQGYHIPLVLKYNQEKLEAFVQNIAATLDSEPSNAKIVQENAEIKVVQETIGYKVNVAETLAAIIDKLKSGIPLKVELVIAESQPKIIAADLADIDCVLASYTTEFNPNNHNRVQNIILGARNFNNILVHSGESVSFNEVVGPRLEKYGFKEAPGFINGKLVPDWGGGICQLTSTLYNAVLLANLAIEERTSHCQPPGYVPLGQDATVADNLLDFKFKNNSAHSIYIKSEVSGGSVTIYVFGKNGDKPEIKIIATDKKVIEPQTIVKQDADLEVGREVVESEGQRGFSVTTWRIRNYGRTDAERELLATDEYSPEDRVVRVGTKNQTSVK
ncbi:MAG: VanW family protein [Pelosinus sp.]|nr:VanW family protein [Pelosinus sp.]